MAETIKVLGQSAPGAAATILYTVPANKAAVVSLLQVCNGGGAAAYTFRLAVNPAGGAGIGGAAQVVYDAPIGINEVIELLRGVTLQAAATVAVYGSHANVSFQLYGVESDV